MVQLGRFFGPVDWGLAQFLDPSPSRNPLGDIGEHLGLGQVGHAVLQSLGVGDRLGNAASRLPPAADGRLNQQGTQVDPPSTKCGGQFWLRR